VEGLTARRDEAVEGDQGGAWGSSRHRDDVAAFAVPSFVPRIIEWPSSLLVVLPLFSRSLSIAFVGVGWQLNAFPSMLSNRDLSPMSNAFGGVH
jgi:hypothetical protein